jgi:thiamine-phosphate pyrophosphorylase
LKLAPGLILITDRKRSRRPLVEVCGAAVRAGFAAVMLREKDLEARELLALAEPLAQVCHSLKKALIINGRLDVVLAVPGAGAHVGRDGVPVADARRILGPGRLLGYSAHEIAEAREALDAGADYVTVSPIFPSFSKPGVRPRGLSFLRSAVQGLAPRPVVALGGMDPDRLPQVKTCGAHCAAVLGAVMQAEDPKRVAADLVAVWTGGAGRE